MMLCKLVLFRINLEVHFNMIILKSEPLSFMLYLFLILFRRLWHRIVVLLEIGWRLIIIPYPSTFKPIEKVFLELVYLTPAPKTLAPGTPIP